MKLKHTGIWGEPVKSELHERKHR